MITDELLRKAQGGDIEARNEIIEKSINLVKYFMRRRHAHPNDIEDLLQEGILGVISGIARFDPAKGRYSTYLAYWINQRFNEWIEKQRFYAKNVPLENTLDIPEKCHSPLDSMEIRESIRRLCSAIRHMNPRTRMVLELRYGLNGNGGLVLSRKVIGKMLNVSQERVRQIEVEGCEYLKERL